MMEAFMAQQQAYEQQQLLESGAGLVDEYGQPVAFPSEASMSNEATHEAAGGFTPLKPFSAFNQISLSSVSSDTAVTNQPMGEPSTPVVTGYLQDVLTLEQYEAKVAAGEITETQGFTPVLMEPPPLRLNTDETKQV
jgi:hypothetical protein